MTKNLRKVYPLFKCGNIYDLKKIIEARETSTVEVRKIVWLSAPINKMGRPTYLSNDRGSLVVLDYGIGGGHGLPLVSNYILDKLQHIINAVKLRCG